MNSLLTIIRQIDIFKNKSHTFVRKSMINAMKQTKRIKIFISLLLVFLINMHRGSHYFSNFFFFRCDTLKLLIDTTM